MRSLLVIAGATAVAAAFAVGASPPVALHPGDRITDRQLFAYLSFGPHVGDWMQYRVVFLGGATALKTIGFGVESVGGKQTLYVETHVRALAVTGLAPGTTTGIGTDAVLKTYVTGVTFADLSSPYRVVTSALKVGDFEYEIPPGTPETYTALAGDANLPARDGAIKSVDPIDMRVGAQSVHATHVVAMFASIPLPAGGVSNGYTLEVWQSPDVPAGTVAISSGGSRSVHWRLLAYGRGYRSLFKKGLDALRGASQPAMP